MMTSRTNTRALSGVLSAVAVLMFVPAFSMRADGGLPKPPELKTLEAFIGDWTTEATITILGGQPVNLKSTGTATRKWALDGRIVEESGKGSDGNESKVVFTYDVLKKCYRNWYFSSDGYNVDSSGQWDEAAKTFNFSCDLGNGVTQASTIHVTDGDHHEWASKVTDGTGKILFDGGGKLARKK